MIYGIDHRIPCSDHLGNHFPSIKEMCAQYNIHPETYTRRRKVYKWSIEKALITPVKRNGGEQCMDYSGKRFKSITKMCKYHNISRKVFEYRIKHGWTLMDALTLPPRRKDDRNA